MQPSLRKILVIGGNGFVGSAVCKAALSQGMQVTSVSSTGHPYRTAKGHAPAWTSKVDWQKGDALHPHSFAHLFSEVTGVVHTLGTLIEDGNYKRALKEGDVPGLLGSFFQSCGIGGSGNPLKSGAGQEGKGKGSYESMNRDTALRVCEAFVSAPVSGNIQFGAPRPFIYISAEDIFRPVIPARYVETKREAEHGIEEILLDKPDYRGVYIRPSLVYHAHHRPLTSPAAVLLDLSATLHAKVPLSIPTPSSILRSLSAAFPPAPSSPPGPSTISSSPLDSIANALTIPPIHVEHVAAAICVALDPARADVRGVVGVRQMRELIGWSERA